MQASDAPVLLADIGGTNARFALADARGVGPIERLEVDDYPDPIAAMRAFLSAAPAEKAPRRAALAVAGPVDDGRAALTNGTWQFESSAIAAALELDRVQLVNDFAAVAWAVPDLSPEDRLELGGRAALASAPVAVIGPGTGLGVAGFLPGRDNAPARVLVTEGGHVTMAACSAHEEQLLERLRARFGHVSAERLLSGDGLENLYAAAAAISGRRLPERSAPEIVALAESGDCAVCRAALDDFFAMLGTFAGNVALTMGARGGVYLGGGILPRVADRLAASSFRARFEDKGRFRDYLAPIPVWLITRPDPAFLGLASLARQD